MREPESAPASQHLDKSPAHLAGRRRTQEPAKRRDLLETAAEGTDSDAHDHPGWLTLSGHLHGSWALPATMHLERDVWGGNLDLGGLLRLPMPPGGQRTVTVARDGMFRFHSLVPGTYILRIEGQDPTNVTRRIEVWRDVEDLALEAQRRTLCTLRGTLEVAESLSDTRGTIHVTPGQVGVRVPPGGAFVMHALVPGPAVLTVRRMHWRKGTEGALHVRSYERSYELDLRSPETVWRGRLLADVPVWLRADAPSLGRPTRGELRLRSSEGATETWRLELDGNGVLRQLTRSMMSGGEQVIEGETENRALHLTGLTPSTHTLTLDLPGYVSESREVHIDGPTTLRWPLRRQPGRWIRVRTKAKTWWLEARLQDGERDDWRQILWADDRVHWCWRRHPYCAYLAEGHYRLRMRSVSWATTEWGPVEVRDSVTPLVIRPALARGASLQGAVLAPDLRWINGVWLHLFRQRTDRDWERVREKSVPIEEARYAFHGLDPGRYRVAPTEVGMPVLAEVDVGVDDVECRLNLGPGGAGTEDPAR